jgi:two-component system, chemotaxis family, chemotaxis protein CheY
MKKILIVDDSPSVRQQVRLALSQAGFAVIEANDGMDGIQKLDSTPDVALVVSDVNMPRMNGLDMVEKVKSEPKHKALPVLMLTSEGQPALIERAKKAGVKGWVVKPFNADMLVAAIKKLVPN